MKQGRIERQYSPVPSKLHLRQDKKLDSRTPAWAKHKDTDDSTLTSWASKIPSIFPFALITGSGSPLRSPNSPLFRPQSSAGTLSTKVDFPAMGMPSNLKGGSDLLAGTLERKSSLKKPAGDSHVERYSQLKVVFQVSD